jgi:hypothetical protein
MRVIVLLVFVLPVEEIMDGLEDIRLEYVLKGVFIVEDEV